MMYYWLGGIYLLVSSRPNSFVCSKVIEMLAFFSIQYIFFTVISLQWLNVICIFSKYSSLDLFLWLRASESMVLSIFNIV